ncbi:MAG: MFS transporter [Bacteroidales bacterium]|nr:MFS transporter [Bacteroidales bacterium]
MDTQKRYNLWQWRIIIVSMVCYAIFYFVRKNFSIAMPGLTAEYGISNTSFGIIIGLGSIVYGLARFINGFIVDKVSTKVFMAIGLFLCALANFCFGFGADLSYLITGVHDGPQFVNMLILVMGVTIVLNQYFQGMGYPPCARMLPTWIPPGQLATKMSIWNTSHSIGAIAASVVCGLIMSNMGADMTGDSSVVHAITQNLAGSIKGWDGLSAAEQTSRVLSYAGHYGAWRWCFWIPALFALVGGILILIGLKDRPQDVGLPEVEGTHTGKDDTAGQKGAHSAFLRHMVFKNRWVWTLSIANIFVYVLRVGVLDWGPKFLTEHRGMDIKSAAWSVAFFELLAIFGTIFAGWATDHIFKGKAHRMCVFSMIGAVVFFGLFALLPNINPFLSIFILALGGFCIYGPQALIGIGAANQATKEASATANGLTGILGYVGSALAAIAIGLIADKLGWNAVFMTFIFVGIIGVLIFLSMWKAPRDGYARAQAFTSSLIGEAKELVSGAKALDKEVAKEEKEEEIIREQEENS